MSDLCHCEKVDDQTYCTHDTPSCRPSREQLEAEVERLRTVNAELRDIARIGLDNLGGHRSLRRRLAATEAAA